MNKFKSNPSKTILVIITGLMVIYFFTKMYVLLQIVLLLGVIGVFSRFLSVKIENLWFRIAYVLSLIIPNILLGVIFYLFLFPISLLSKIWNKDLLHLRNNSDTIYKEVKKSFNKESFKNTW
ncbi:MAG: hypothetical protein CMC45_00735 [Flavobacteriaceae bacterium]|nr:hypothetical protein [Flavobacteriaceae bacterium]|tara:strand:+ start:3948 stop:4313 length:366 start_codon:yes stop_codon:yes gene_type:complete